MLSFRESRQGGSVPQQSTIQETVSLDRCLLERIWSVDQEIGCNMGMLSCIASPVYCPGLDASSTTCRESLLEAKLLLSTRSASVTKSRCPGVGGWDFKLFLLGSWSWGDDFRCCDQPKSDRLSRQSAPCATSKPSEPESSKLVCRLFQWPCSTPPKLVPNSPLRCSPTIPAAFARWK